MVDTAEEAAKCLRDTWPCGYWHARRGCSIPECPRNEGKRDGAPEVTMVHPSPDAPLPAVAASEPGPLSRPTADAPLPLVAQVVSAERRLDALEDWRTSVEKLEDAIQAAVMRLQEQMATVHSDLTREHAYLREKIAVLEELDLPQTAIDVHLLKSQIRRLAALDADDLRADEKTRQERDGRMHALEEHVVRLQEQMATVHSDLQSISDWMRQQNQEPARPDHVLVPLLRYQVLEEAVEAYRRQPRDHRVDAAEAIAKAACDLVVTVQHDD